MKNLIKNRQQYIAKATAAYAGVKTAHATGKQAANLLAHTWRIDSDYAWDLYTAAMEYVVANKRDFSPLRTERVTGEWPEDEGERFRETDWTWVPRKGVSMTMQVRYAGGALEFRAPRKKELDLLGEELDIIVARQEEEAARIMIVPEPVTRRTAIYSWDAKKAEWDSNTVRMSRTFSSVVLPAELQAEIERDLDQFSKSKDRLGRLEMPWRRGYLLSGPPGTGKTSLSLTIAGQLGFNLASLSLTDIEDDAMLKKAVSSLRRTVLVIEDIDAYSVSHDRDHNTSRDGGLSLSGLLNSLDGFETPDGLVVIVTTNHIEHLDPALIRSGRLDRQFHLGYIDAPEIERLYAWFYESAPPFPAPSNTPAAELAPAEVTELFKQHLEDGPAGWAAVMAAIESKTAPTLKAVA